MIGFARLTLAAPGRWVLKGALALDFRMGERTRTTKDMDLVWQDDEQSATADLVACQSVDLDDFFVFAIQKAGRITEEQDGGDIRYRVRAELAGRLFENVIVDIGFSDPLAWEPEVIRGTDLLSFAGFDRIEVPALPLEQHVAEKVHAYTGRYSRGRSSSRVKDLIDLVLVKQSMQLDAERLRTALVGVFEGRKQQALPEAFPPPPPEWKVPYGRLASEIGLDPDLVSGHREVSDLLDDILGGLEEGSWDSTKGAWI